MAGFYDDNEDLRWYVERGIDWEPIVRLTEYDWQSEDGFRSVEEATEFYVDVLRLVGDFSAEQIAPRAAELDAAHPHLVDGEVVDAPVVKEIFEQLGGLGLPGLCLPRELGGMSAPLMIMQLTTELLGRGDVSVCAHSGFHGGIALASLMYSVMEGTTEFQTDPPAITSTRFQECIDDVLENGGWGSMDLTEPDAGSDLGALRCRGDLAEDGSWTVTGSKVFITSGHGRWHYVLARTEERTGDDAFGGLAGLSLFLVPAWSFDAAGERVKHASFDGVEVKLGHNASATVTISFDAAPAELVGQRGEGFKQMLLLMNNARVTVGFECLGVSEAALRAAKAYAAERRSMGRTIDKHELVADMLDEMDIEVRAMRALSVHGAWHEEISRKLDLLLRIMPPTDDADRAQRERELKRHKRRSRALTPLLKWYAGERAVDICRRSLQVHGGAGYIKETGVEKLLRDSLVFPIYEGTSQIQALMATKDALLGAVKDPAGLVRRAAKVRWRSVSARDPLEKRVAGLRVLADQATRHLLSKVAVGKISQLPPRQPAAWKTAFADWDPKSDFAPALLHAERLTGLLTNAAVAELFWEQCARDAGRRELLVTWLERAEPESRYLLDQIHTTGGRLLARLAGADVSERQAAS